MIGAIEDITVNEGIDPRQSQLICGGGATACHIGEMAQNLGIQQFMVPKLAAGLSAYGGLLSDVRWEETATLHVTDRNFDFARVSTLLLELKRRGAAFLDRAGFPSARHRFEFAFQGRYLYQSWDIEVHFQFQGTELRKDDVHGLRQAFHQTHERIYTIKDEAEIIEFTIWKVRAIGDNNSVARRGRPLPQQVVAIAPKSERLVYLGTSGGKSLLPVYDGAAIGAGATISGPCIIEEPTTTILLQAGQIAATDEFGNYLVSVTC
jgi:N-methylhydantoinase A